MIVLCVQVVAFMYNIELDLLLVSRKVYRLSVPNFLAANFRYSISKTSEKYQVGKIYFVFFFPILLCI